MSVTIVIPAKNEEDSIISTLNDLKKKVKIKHKIIVVDDQSEDSTAKKVLQYAKRNKKVSLVKTTPKKHGFSNALKLGISNAQTSYVVIVMADLCDDPKTIYKMYRKISKGYDIVCGSRYTKGGRKIGGPKLQSVFSAFICLSLHHIVRVPTKDVSNAFKMYKKEILNNVTFNPVSGVEASMEITLQAFFKGAKIVDIPTTWHGRTMGKSKFKIITRTPKYFRIYRWAIENAWRKMLSRELKKFYIK